MPERKVRILNEIMYHEEHFNTASQKEAERKVKIKHGKDDFSTIRRTR